MALNPFFLKGSQGEQRLVQDLINEQLSMYGIEVIYLPRKIVNKDNIFREVEASKFNDNFSIEAYVNTYEGYTGAGDIMTKFGMSLKDDLVVTISRERWEDFIGSFLGALPADEIEVASRPSEGDLIYFPLGERIFEVKFVEHEKPFYQLGKNYVYELQCELFELEDEVGGWDNISTGTEQIDDALIDYGYMTSLKLVSVGSTATVAITTSTGYIRNITLNNDGYDYTIPPIVSISTSPTGLPGDNATAVAITTSIGNSYSVKEILLTHAGVGYTVAPTVTIVSSATTAVSGITTYHGVGAAATATIVTDDAGIRVVSIANSGSGYTVEPEIYFEAPASGIGTAVARTKINSDNNVTDIYIVNAGIGYTISGIGPGIATIASPPVIAGVGTYQFNEVVIGSVSGAKGRVKSYDQDDNILKLGTTDGTFVAGDIIIGAGSSAQYGVDYIIEAEFSDKYDQSDEIEKEADAILDFTESNPFGNF